MKLSLDWLSDFVTLPADLDLGQLAYDLTMKTVEVEQVEVFGAELDGVVVARIEAVEDVAGRAMLRCSTGTETVTVEAPAVSLVAGMHIALEGASVVRSISSLGVGAMLEAVATDGPAAYDLTAFAPKIGQPIAALFGWSDTVLEIDNKSLSNRPDLWCHHGMARELAAIYGCELRAPDLAHPFAPEPMTNLVGAADASFCDRFSVLELTRSRSMPDTPLWMRSRLARIGQRPINLYVDLSNYVMYSVGQPSHSYDATLVVAPLSAVPAERTETVETLDGAEHEIPMGAPAIVDAKTIVGVAGIVGSVASRTVPETATMLFEMAAFQSTPIRRASLSLGIRTDASTRFEKGIDTQRVDLGRGHFLNLLAQVDPGASVVGIQEIANAETARSVMTVSLAFLEARIGRRLDADEVVTTLDRLGFETTVAGDVLTVTAPTWRSTGDVGIPEDLVEEIARLIGYDSFGAARPSITLRMPSPRPRGWLARRVREHLAFRARMQEIVTYPWVEARRVTALGLDSNSPVLLEAPPSPDRAALRPSLLPNLLEAVESNLGRAPELRIFEVGKVFMNVPEGPTEWLRVAGACTGIDLTSTFRAAKGAVEGLERSCQLRSLDMVAGGDAPWADPVACLGIVSGGAAIGTLGAVGSDALKQLGLRDVHVVCFEIDLEGLDFHQSRANSLEAISQYPEVEFDLSFVLKASTPWKAISDALASLGEDLLRDVALTDEYRGKSMAADEKSITFRCTLGSFDHTLERDEINAVRDRLIATVTGQFQADLRG